MGDKSGHKMSGSRPVGFVYMLRCKDGSYYIGSHRGDDPAKRASEHNHGLDKHAYTFTRRPVELVYSEPFDRFEDMVAYERRIKGWSRAKKEALIRGDGGALREFSKRGVKPSLIAHPSRRLDRLATIKSPQDEGRLGCNRKNPHPEERCRPEPARRREG